MGRISNWEFSSDKEENIQGDIMGMEKSTVDDLRRYLSHCIDKEGIVDGKRRFSLQLGLLENALFTDMDDVYSSISHISEYTDNFKDSNLEELPVVDDGSEVIFDLIAVS